jgi:hypothetical protein
MDEYKITRNHWLMKCNRTHIDFDDSLSESLKEKYEHLYVSLIDIEDKFGKIDKLEVGLDIAQLLATSTSAPCPPLTKGLQIRVLPRWSDVTWYNPKLRDDMMKLRHDGKLKTYVTTDNIIWKGYK